MLRPKPLLFLLGVAALGAAVSAATLGGPDIRPEQTLAEFSSAVHDHRLQVDFGSRPNSQRRWVAALDGAQRAAFVTAASRADSGHATSHCVWIHEAQIQLRVGPDRATYFSTVCKQEPDAVILTKIVESVDANGTRKLLQYPGVRIPGLGPWVMKVAPEGAR